MREDPQNPDVLYAGLEGGVWFSLDRGAHWQSLRLNMPSVAVHDMRVQPQRHDLLVATHGRGFWILDDAAAIAGLQGAVAGAAPRALCAADRLHVVSLVDELLRNASRRMLSDHRRCTPAKNPPEGATISYYLPSAEGASLDVLDSSGRLVRSLEAPGKAGVNRATWDLTEDTSGAVE